MRLAHCRAWWTIASFPRWCAAFSGAGVLSSWLSCRHGLGAAGRQEELRFGEGLNELERSVRSKLAQEKACGRDVDERELRDDVVHHFDAGEWQRTFFQNFWFVVARGVLHGDEDALGAGDEVHRAAHAFQHFSGDGPISERALFIHLQRAENGEVYVAAANHGERIGGGEIATAGKLG